MSEGIHKRVNVYLDRKIHGFFVEEVGEQHVSEFFRIVEEELLSQPGEDRDLSLRKRAQEATEMAKRRFFEQRRLIQDEEAEKQRAAKQVLERKSLIEQTTREFVKKLGFRREYLRDREHMCWQKKRDELADEISIACRIDLQWKELYPVVAAVVLEEDP